MYTKASNRAVQRYCRKNYDVISIRVKKGQKDPIKQRAEEIGMSLNGYIVSLIMKDIKDSKNN